MRNPMIPPELKLQAVSGFAHKTNVRSKNPLSSLLAAFCIVVGAQSQAATVHSNQPLNFNAPSQSFWGGGTGYSFGTKGSKKFLVDFAWDIGASSGTVAAAIAGNLSAEFDNRLGERGRTDVRLSFSGTPDGSSVYSDLGAWVKAWALSDPKKASPNLVNEGIGLRPGSTFTAGLGNGYTFTDQQAVAGVGVDVIIASAGINLGIEQTNSLNLTGLNGILYYQYQGLNGYTGPLYQTPFSLGASGTTVLNPTLSEYGTWNLWVDDLSLQAEFTADFDVDLWLYETHPDGITWCSRKVFGFRLKWPCGLSYDTNEFEIASVSVYDGDTFQLAFDDVAAGPRFTIQVPEPGSAALGVAGLFAVIAQQRLRARARIAAPETHSKV